MFEHFVFTRPDEAMAHLTREQRGMLGPAVGGAHAGDSRRSWRSYARGR